jgi:hypothetical protein
MSTLGVAFGIDSDIDLVPDGDGDGGAGIDSDIDLVPDIAGLTGAATGSRPVMAMPSTSVPLR